MYGYGPTRQVATDDYAKVEAATQSHPAAETITVAFRGVRAALYLVKDLIKQGRYSSKLLGHSHHSVFEPVTVLPDGES